MVFTKKQQHFTLTSAPALCFFTTFEVSRGNSNWLLKNYGFTCNAISSLVRMCKSLSNEM